MDVQNMEEFTKGEFDAIIDKGTLDALLCGDNSRPNSDEMIDEVYRVLSGDGVYICISYGYPDDRLCYFQNSKFNWKISTHQVNKMTTSVVPVVQDLKNDPDHCHYIYVMKKLDGPEKPLVEETIEAEGEEGEEGEDDDEEEDI